MDEQAFKARGFGQTIGFGRRSALVAALLGVVVALWYFLTSSVPEDLTGMTPYLTTLLVLALFSQRLRMPAADGKPYRKGSAG